MKRIILIVALLAVGILLPTAAFAQGPVGNYASGIACLNLSAGATNASIMFYNQNGGLVTTVNNATMNPNAPWLLFTPNIQGLGANFLGSAVVSSGAEVACSVNTQTVGGTQRVGTAEGLASGATGPKLYATQVLNNAGGFNSYVAVQNASSDAADVRVTYFNAAGQQQGTPTTTSVPGNASKVFYQDAAGLPAGFNGSATFESVNGTTPLAGAVAIYNSNGAQLLSFNTFKQGAAKVFLPRVSKNLSGQGYTAGWACQNLGPGVANMTMQVSMLNQGNGQTVNATLTRNGVAVNQSWLGYFGSTTGDAGLDAITRGFGSAVVTATGGNIACTVNEDNRTGGGNPALANLIGQGATYGGVPDGEQSNSMFFPQIVALGANSFRGGFQIANTTANATTCTYTFSNGDVVNNVPLAGNGSNSVFAESALTNNKTNFNGSVRVQCGQPIVGIYNLSIIGGAAAGDPYAANNGINQ
jgi:hypothetical protein